MKQYKHIVKHFVVWTMIFTMVSWTLSLPLNLSVLIPKAQAAGGIDAMYTDDGGSTPDVYLDATSTPESIIKLELYDEAASTLNSVSVDLEPGMNCETGYGGTCTDSPFAVTDLGSLSTASTSGLSLWLDANGNGTFDFDENVDKMYYFDI